MTFVLGLVAEPIPFKSVNTPKGDRLAEVKGRQVLEKYNCAGCHLIRPGLFEIKATKQVIKALVQGAEENPAEHVFPQSYNWVGSNPKGDVLTAFTSSSSPNLKGANLILPLTHAVRFVVTEPNGNSTFKDVRAAENVSLPKKDILYPPPEAFQSQKTLNAYLHDHGPFGGAFSMLLAKFVYTRNPEKYKAADAGEARIAGPPILIGQGERTQGEWLYQFLLKPEPIRKETVLRMPRFNMSPEEARMLVSYFAGVERLNNTGVGLTFPFDRIPQQEDLDSPFWRERTAAYVSRLRKEKTKDAKGKETTQLDLRLKEMQPIWEQILKDNQNQLTSAKASLEGAKAKRKAVEDAKKDFAKEEEYAFALQAADGVLKTWENEVERLEKMVKTSGVKDQQAIWEEREAYVTDGYRMLTNLCLSCHQVGILKPSPDQLQGPPLDLTAKRLQPGWTERWIAYPQRFVPYVTVMPANFPKNQTGQYQHLIAGSSLDQILSVRDTLMILPRVQELPAGRFLTLPLTGAAKTGEKK
jgi:mono/diheme cytochrome c family protein